MFKTVNQKIIKRLNIAFDSFFYHIENLNNKYLIKFHALSNNKKIGFTAIFLLLLLCSSLLINNLYKYQTANIIEKNYYQGVTPSDNANPGYNSSDGTSSPYTDSSDTSSSSVSWPSFPSVSDIVIGIVTGIVNPRALLRALILQYVTNLCLQYGANAFNACCSYAVNLLTMHPDSWADGKGYAISKNLSAAFQVIATVLLVVFFLIGLCDEAIDNNKEIRLESVIRLIIRFALSEFLVVNCFMIISGFFTIVDDMLPYINGNASVISGDMSDVYSNLVGQLSPDNQFTVSPDTSMDFTSAASASISGKAIIYLVIAVIYFFVSFISGCILVFEAFFRFFKILILLPYGTIANSTLAGTNAMRQTAIQFWKYALSVILDAITMLIALRIFAVVFSTIDIFEGFIDSDVGKVLTQICFFFVLIGVIKGSSNITKQALGI